MTGSEGAFQHYRRFMEHDFSLNIVGEYTLDGWIPMINDSGVGIEYFLPRLSTRHYQLIFPDGSEIENEDMRRATAFSIYRYSRLYPQGLITSG